MRLLRKLLDRLVGLGERQLCVVFGKRFAAFVVGIVGGFGIHGLLHRRAEPLDAEITARWQRCRGPLVRLDAFLRRRMARKQAAQPVRTAPLAQAHEGFLQLHRTLRIVAGVRHVTHAVFIGLQFGATPIRLVNELRADTRTADGQVRIAAVAGQYRRADDTDLQPGAALHLLC